MIDSFQCLVEDGTNQKFISFKLENKRKYQAFIVSWDRIIRKNTEWSHLNCYYFPGKSQIAE